MATEERLSPLRENLLSMPSRKLEYDSCPELFTAMFLPPTWLVVKDSLPNYYGNVTNTLSHGWMERALNSIVVAFVEDTKSNMNTRQNMWLAFRKKDLLMDVIGLMDNFIKTAHSTKTPLRFYTRCIYWFHSRLHSKKEVLKPSYLVTENVACELMRVYVVMLQLVLSGPTKDDQDRPMFKLFAQPPPNHLMNGFPSSFYHPDNDLYSEAKCILDKMNNPVDWKVEPWWRSSLHWEWCRPGVSLPHPPDNVNQDGTRAAHMHEDPFAEYFQSMTPYCQELLNTAYIDYLERTNAILKNSLEQTRDLQAKIIGLVVSAATIVGHYLLQKILVYFNGEQE